MQVLNSFVSSSFACLMTATISVAETIVPCGTGDCGTDLQDISQHRISVENPTAAVATQDCSGAFGGNYTRAVVAVVPQGAEQYILYGFVPISPMFQQSLRLEGDLLIIDNSYRVYYYAEKEGERTFVQQGGRGDTAIQATFEGNSYEFTEARMFFDGAIWLRAWCPW